LPRLPTQTSRVIQVQQDSIDVLTDSEDEGIGLEDIANLIKILKKTVVNQNIAIEDLKTELKEIKPKMVCYRKQFRISSRNSRPSQHCRRQHGL
jgi:hypothetical protein